MLAVRREYNVSLKRLAITVLERMNCKRMRSPWRDCTARTLLMITVAAWPKVEAMEQVTSTLFLSSPGGEAAGQLMSGNWGSSSREKQRENVCAFGLRS